MAEFLIKHLYSIRFIEILYSILCGGNVEIFTGIVKNPMVIIRFQWGFPLKHQGSHRDLPI